ncbi:hypothetical protein DL96DRAFT_1530669 [Flagelloscypha sp. PMI_526]|nr:hypothetical protein DL96DRAFT_1530669 [Flagelloscypha sp. PMI_526]
MSHSQAEGSAQGSSSPPTSYRPWSAVDTPSHHMSGNSSYFSPAATPSASRRMYRSASSAAAPTTKRSTSIASRALSEARDEEEEAEEGEDSEGNDRDSVGNPIDPEEELAGSEIDPITLKDRQSLMNVQHPFGLPIWKPALYKKSRSVQRHADEALHNVPSSQAERHISPGNIFWIIFFGWWLSAVCLLVSLLLYFLPDSLQFYRLTFGLGWYILWPFGKYVEGLSIDFPRPEASEDEEPPNDSHSRGDSAGSSGGDTIRPDTTNAAAAHAATASWNPPTEHTSLLQTVSPGSSQIHVPSKSYGAVSLPDPNKGIDGLPSSKTLGQIAFWIAFVCIIAPLLLLVCLICWGLVLTVPMAKLNWQLVKHLWEHPTSIRFCSAPKAIVREAENGNLQDGDDDETISPTDVANNPSHFSVKRMRLAAGQSAPGLVRDSTVLLCTYHAAGFEYYKYTLGGVNIIFVNLLAVVVLVIIDGNFIMEAVEERMKEGEQVSLFLRAIANRGLVFFMSLLSIIPLSYFIGQAVASISAQSSIGMGAVINATFGSLIEIILYGMMLVEGKGLLVEGSLVGSLLAGVLLMPGLSMCSSALKRKEQKFNAKSAGVTSMMLIMAVIGILAPTLFYQTYGNFELVCTGCPTGPVAPGQPWRCNQCYYEHPDPLSDPFYQSTVKQLMYFSAVILVLSYLIGLWFSLRTHASQIWQNPQQVMHPETQGQGQQGLHSVTGSLTHRLSVYTSKLKAPSIGGRRPSSAGPPPQRDGSTGTATTPRAVTSITVPPPNPRTSAPPSPTLQRHISFTQETVDAAVKQHQPNLKIPENMSADEFTRAVAVATVSALRAQQRQQQQQQKPHGGDEGGHGGHDAPNWSRTLSASVLLACTVLYAIIAELLVDCVDVILGDSSGSEKFLGITLFALAPNTTEFMNAISFALNGNIALSMEIGSAYALQVCLLQIPAMVAFSAWYNPTEMGKVATTFTLIFPRWDVVVLILSMFLMTYTFVEAKSNYHRGSILILSYVVLVAGFYWAPAKDNEAQGAFPLAVEDGAKRFVLGWWEGVRYWVGRQIGW